MIANYEAGIPNITSPETPIVGYNPYPYRGYEFRGAFGWRFDGAIDAVADFGDVGGFGGASDFIFDASRCSLVYGRSDTVQPSAMTVNYFIRAR